MNDDDEPQPLGDDDGDAEGVQTAVPDKRQRLSIKARRRIEQREEIELWIAVLSTPVGRRTIWNLLQSAHAFEERFGDRASPFPHPEATWFRAGEQAFGQRLYQMLLAFDPGLVAAMHAEHDPVFQANVRVREGR